ATDAVSTPDAAPDAARDAGAATDLGSPSDAGTTADAGTAADASAPPPTDDDGGCSVGRPSCRHAAAPWALALVALALLRRPRSPRRAT
ncbi:MAG: hypothetical protein JWM10_4226, partial [Myxococcaceae bacterium]|nr:hypothetical protein [Myxococcaceae bacterium]